MSGSARGPAHAPKTGRFLAGNSEYLAKKRRVAERLQQLVAAYDTSPAFVQFLAIAAKHLDDAEHARSALARTRATNSARRLLSDIPRKRLEPRRRSLQEALAKAATP